jgi:hypothetical protein
VSNDLTATKISRAFGALYDQDVRYALEKKAEFQRQLVDQMLNPPMIISEQKMKELIPFFPNLKGDSKVTTKKAKPEKFNTIGVRFIGGQNPEKIYTYKVRIGAKVYLGQELIADTARGPAAVVVVRTDKTPNQFETCPIEGLKYIEKKAVAL